MLLALHPTVGNAAYLAAHRRTYAPFSILSALMVVAIALCLLLYRTMKTTGVHLSAVRTKEGRAEAEDAVGDMNSDEVMLLEHDILSLSSDSQTEDSEEAIL